VNTHPIIQLIVNEMKAHGWTYRTMEDASGVSRGAFGRWEHDGVVPSLLNAEVVLNVLGYELTVVRRPGPSPKPPRQPYDTLRRPRRDPGKRRRPYTGPRKLTQEQVDDIRSRRMKGVEYAKLYDISSALVTQIQLGNRWPDPPPHA
jgi:transcriptional regulator with XRE-family HTH domain